MPTSNNDMVMELNNLCRLSTDRVERRNDPYFWQVDGYKLDNKHLALWYEKQNQTNATFVFNNHERLKNNLSDKKIDLTHNYHLDFLKHLRLKHRKLNLLYSGGTDSATILDLAHDNNIIIDETITWVIEDIDLDSNSEQKYIVPAGIKKYQKAIGKSSQIICSHDDLEKRFEDRFAFFSGPCDSNFPIGFSVAKYTALKKYYDQEDMCMISGLDKPRLLYYKKKWYAFCVDNAVAFGDQSIPNLVPFYMDTDNIKGYVKDCLLFRNYLLEKKMVSDEKIQFFNPGQSAEINKVFERVKIEHEDKQFPESTWSNNSQKNSTRFKELFARNRFTLLGNYFRALNTFFEIFPQTKTNAGLDEYHKNGKFAWFIDIESLEVFTQHELIPNGF